MSLGRAFLLVVAGVLGIRLGVRTVGCESASFGGGLSQGLIRCHENGGGHFPGWVPGAVFILLGLWLLWRCWRSWRQGR